MLENRELAGHMDSLLQKLSELIYRQKNKFAEEAGISRQQFDVLSIIYDKGQVTMGELCKEISSACSTATDLADKLERAGYVERLREKSDRRVVRLSILPKGEKLLKTVVDNRADSLGKLLESFEYDELMNTISFLETLTDKLERI